MGDTQEGRCAVCNEPASETCALCESIAYCGPEHQKTHWPNHKSQCRPYREAHSDTLGRYLTATRDMKSGEVVLKELPLVMGPRADSTPLCLSCYKLISGPPVLCSKCNTVPVCGAVCERCGDHTVAECAAYSATTSFDLTENWQVVLPLRFLLLRRSGHANWDALMRLEAHMEQRRDMPVWVEHQIGIIEVLRSQGLLLEGEDDELLQKICGVLDVNSFEVRGPMTTKMPPESEQLRAIYLQASLMAHDCVPNTHLAVDDSFQMTIHASVPIPRGDCINFSYTTALQNTADRREHLTEGKYFLCTCARCSDPTELGTHVSSLRCVRCESGLMSAVCSELLTTQRNHVDDAQNKWCCSNCGHKVRACLVASTVARARALLEDVDRNSTREMEALLTTLLHSFPPQHSLLLELKQTLVALYRDIIMRERSPSRKILARKAELCRDLLPVLEVIEPGISRLRGITLYELHVPLVLLANREFQSGDIQPNELLSRLQEAEKHLRDAVTQLLYEPHHSPEGQLARVAMQELRGLRQNIQDVYHLRDQKAAAKKGAKLRRK